MPNILFELDRLRVALENKGFDSTMIEGIIGSARNEIRDAFIYQGEAAMNVAIEKGVEKRSADFINELRLDAVNMRLTTDSGNMDFSTPPYPNLHNLLKGNVKPMKDGSGVYKVIPVGQSRSNGSRPKISTNIYDAHKQINAQRAEEAGMHQKAIAPKGSVGKAQFRTATSKQDPASKWVIPAQNKNFTDDVMDLNKNIDQTMDEIIARIIDSYVESF